MADEVEKHARRKLVKDTRRNLPYYPEHCHYIFYVGVL